MADNVRVAAEGGIDSGTFPSRGTWEAPFATAGFAKKDLRVDINNGHNGEVVLKGGIMAETSPIIINRAVTMGGIGSALGGFDNGTTVKRNHTGALIEYDPGFTDWEHMVVLKNMKLDGNKTGQPTVATILRMLKPGFNTQLLNIRFDASSDWGYEIDQGANSLTTVTCGFSSCDGGAMKFESRGASGSTFGFNVVAIEGDTQIDNCGANPILIDVNGSAAGQFRNLFYFGLCEFETSSTSQHNDLFIVDSESTNPLVKVLIEGIVTIDSSNGSGKRAMVSTTNSSAFWCGFSSLSNEHSYHYEDVSNNSRDVTVADWGQQTGDIHAGMWGNSDKPTNIKVGNAGIFRVVGDPNTVFSAPIGSLALSTNGNPYKNTDGASAWALV